MNPDVKNQQVASPFFSTSLRGGSQFRNVNRYRGGLVFKAHRLCVSLSFRLEIDNEQEEEKVPG